MKNTMNMRVKIRGESNGVTLVNAVNGIHHGEDLFIEGTGLGTIGEVIEVPEFRVYGTGYDIANRYLGDYE